MSGRLYGVGVGPGDPELLTLKALRVARAADVIGYVAAGDGPSAARAVIAAHLPGGQREIPIRLAMGKDASDAYAAAAAHVAAALDDGADVAVLCLGDPLLYGSFIYLQARLAGHYPIEIVPGVVSITAAAAAAGVPLAAQNETFTLVPATLPRDALRGRLLAAQAGAAAVLKVGRHLGKLRAVLDELGLIERAVLCERLGMAGERIAPLTTVSAERAPYFALVLLPSRRAA